MSIKSQYARRETRFVTPVPGVEFEVSFFDPRAVEYIAIVQRVSRPVRRMIEQGVLPPEKDREYAIKAFVEHCVKGWRTVDEDGNVVRPNEIEEDEGQFVPFSRDACIRMFNAYPGLYNDVVDAARDVGTFRLSEDDRGNSGPSSPTS